MKTNVKNSIKGILVTTMILVLFTGFVFASTTLTDGEYTIHVQARNMDTGEVSRADNAITKPTKLEVKNNKINVILQMGNQMTDLSIENKSGGFDLAEKISESATAKTITYKFPIDTIDEAVLVEVMVGGMGSKVKFKIAFNKGTLTNVTTKPTTEGTPAAAPTSPAPTESTPASATPAPTESTSASATPAPTESTPASATPAPTESTLASAIPAPTESTPASAIPAPTESTPASATPAPTESTPASATPAPTENTPASATPAPTESVSVGNQGDNVSNLETENNIFTNLLKVFAPVLVLVVVIYGIYKNKVRRAS